MTLLFAHIVQYLMPFVEREDYQISSKCRLHPDNDLFRDQEQHKIHVDINEWKCGYCKKSFRAEKFLDQHFDNRHYNLLNIVCGTMFLIFIQSIEYWLWHHVPDLYMFWSIHSLIAGCNISIATMWPMLRSSFLFSIYFSLYEIVLSSFMHWPMLSWSPAICLHLIYVSLLLVLKSEFF